MKSQRLFYLLVMLTVIAGALGVQPNPTPAAASSRNQEINALAMAIDNRASMNGLPSGDGNISAGEQMVSEAIWNEINRFNTDLESFEQASPANTAVIDGVEITISDYYVKVFDPASRADAELSVEQSFQQLNDEIIAEIIREAELQQLTDEVIAQIEWDQLNEEIIAELDREATWQELIKATEQYLDEQAQANEAAEGLRQLSDEIANELYAQQIMNELTDEVMQYLTWQELIEATEQYLLENAGADPDKVGQTLKDGASDYIKNDPKIKRKNINRKRVENMIEFYVPSQMLPTNGLWKVRPFNMTMTGPCFQTDHYCDGCGGPDSEGEGEDPDPGEPLCGFENPGGLPFITWQYAMHMYLPGTPSIYSDIPQIDYSTLRDQNGQTVGSTRSERYVEYEVVSPDRIIVHYRHIYDNGCSYSADYEIVLVTADESVCPDLSSYDPTKGDDQTPVSVIEGQDPQKPPFKDDDNKEEAIEEPPAVQQGPYKVGMPFSPLEPACTAEGGVPQFTEVQLLDQGDGTLRIDYGMGQVMVARDGRTSYTFTNGKAGDELETIHLHLDDDGTGSLSWSKTAPDGTSCYQTNEIYLPGTGPEAPIVDEPEADDDVDIPTIETAALENGDYSVEWTVMEQMCPTAMQPMLPTFADATVTVIDDTNVTLTYDGVEVTLTDVANNGNFGYMDATADPLVSVSLSNMPDYGVMLTWMIMPSDGSMCLATAMLN